VTKMVDVLEAFQVLRDVPTDSLPAGVSSWPI